MDNNRAIDLLQMKIPQNKRLKNKLQTFYKDFPPLLRELAGIIKCQIGQYFNSLLRDYQSQWIATINKIRHHYEREMNRCKFRYEDETNVLQRQLQRQSKVIKQMKSEIEEVFDIMHNSQGQSTSSINYNPSKQLRNRQEPNRCSVVLSESKSQNTKLYNPQETHLSTCQSSMKQFKLSMIPNVYLDVIQEEASSARGLSDSTSLESLQRQSFQHGTMKKTTQCRLQRQFHERSQSLQQLYIDQQVQSIDDSESVQTVQKERCHQHQLQKTDSKHLANQKNRLDCEFQLDKERGAFDQIKLLNEKESFFSKKEHNNYFYSQPTTLQEFYEESHLNSKVSNQSTNLRSSTMVLKKNQITVQQPSSQTKISQCNIRGLQSFLGLAEPINGKGTIKRDGLHKDQRGYQWRKVYIKDKKKGRHFPNHLLKNKQNAPNTGTNTTHPKHYQNPSIQKPNDRQISSSANRSNNSLNSLHKKMDKSQDDRKNSPRLLQQRQCQETRFKVGFKAQETRYQGQRLSSIRQGQGILYYSNGLCYEGQFVNGLREGQGILRFNFIQIYNGEWKQDQMNGYGKLRNCSVIAPQTKKTHEKEWQQNLTQLIPSRWTSYCGHFRGNNFHGKGTLKIQGGDQFKGHFQHGKILSQGVLNNQQKTKLNGFDVPGAGVNLECLSSPNSIKSLVQSRRTLEHKKRQLQKRS